MFGELIDKVDGAAIFMILSLCIFLAFFIGASVYVYRARVEHIKKMKNLPLQEGTIESNAL